MAYTRTAILLHWLIALLVALGFGLGLWMVELRFSPQKLQYYAWHKWIGVSIWLLMLLRLAWRSAHRPPPLPATIPAWERFAAQASHVLLYLLLLTMPLSGWLLSSAAGVQVVYLSLVPLPDLVQPDKALADVLKQIHWWFGRVLAVLVALHMAAALKHHFLDRDTVLQRMLPFLRLPQDRM